MYIRQIAISLPWLGVASENPLKAKFAEFTFHALR
jgi:hypothetical protein